MAKIKVTAEIINRWWKRYVAKDWIIEVNDNDLEDFKGFDRVENKVAPKKTKNESNKKRG